MLRTLSLQELAQHTKDASLQHETLDSTFVFYEMTKGQLNVHQVCSYPFLRCLLLDSITWIFEISPCNY